MAERPHQAVAVGHPLRAVVAEVVLLLQPVFLNLEQRPSFWLGWRRPGLCIAREKRVNLYVVNTNFY